MELFDYAPVLQLNSGIGDYPLSSPADQVIAFDFESNGKLDHLVLYRPGAGTIHILKHDAAGFSNVYPEGTSGHGIGGYDLASPSDRIFAFDYESTGKLDHLALYRPGTGTIWILKHAGDAFSYVYQEGSPGHGIGGYDLASPADRAFAFDYDSSGKLDHLVLYRPGTGTIWILKRNGDTFSHVYQEGDPGHGIGGYDLASPADQIFAFDYNSTGKPDHLVLYRPGTGTIWILKNNGRTFEPVYSEGSPGVGIDGYDLASSTDRAFAFDFDASGKLDHLVLYRPGRGRISFLKREPATPPTITGFSPTDGVPEETILIKGHGLRRASMVTIGDGKAAIVSRRATWITATVTADARSGPINIKTPAGEVTSSDLFQLLPPPVIDSFVPITGKAGTGVTIAGQNFRRVTAVRFNGVKAKFKLISDTKIAATVPSGAKTGSITVIGTRGSTTSADSFVVEVTVPPTEPQANLHYMSTWTDPEWPRTGEPLTVFFSFVNGGSAATGEFTIRMILDGGTHLDVRAPSYPSGGTDYVYWRFPNGLSAGRHFIDAYLDILNEVREVSEYDNMGTNAPVIGD